MHLIKDPQDTKKIDGTNTKLYREINTILSITDLKCRQKVDKDMEDMNNTFTYLTFINFY